MVLRQKTGCSDRQDIENQSVYQFLEQLVLTDNNILNMTNGKE